MKVNFFALLLIFGSLLSIYSCRPEADYKDLNEISVATRDSTIHEKIRLKALNKVQDSLKLTDEKFEAVKAIVIEFDDKSIELRNDKSRDSDTKEKRIKNLSVGRKLDLSEHLDKKQVITFNKVYTKFLKDEKALIQKESGLSPEQQQLFNDRIAAFRKGIALPFLTSKRRQLSTLLTPSHKQKIENLRSVNYRAFEELNKKQEECKGIARGARQASLACRKELRKLRENTRKLNEEFSVFEDELRNTNAYSSVFREIEAEEKKWRTELSKFISDINGKEANGDKLPMRRYFKLLHPQSFILVDVEQINLK